MACKSENTGHEISRWLFLIADPQLADPNFRQSVVLIVRHDEESALRLSRESTCAAAVSIKCGSN